MSLIIFILQISSVQSLSRVWLFATPWTAARQASLSITNSWRSLKPMSIELVMPSNHLIHCHPLLLLPSIFPSIRFFFFFQMSQPLCISWPKYWSFSFNISPSNEHPGLICFRMDRLALLNAFKDLRSVQQVFGGVVFLLEAQWRNERSDKWGKPDRKELHDVLWTRCNLLCIPWNHFPFVANPGRQPINQARTQL